jgi:hypothetical protein
MFAWTLRFGLFDLYARGLTWPALLYVAIAVHGICYRLSTRAPGPSPSPGFSRLGRSAYASDPRAQPAVRA